MTGTAELTYAKLTEHNDNEGETWYYYIPVEGNHDALVSLAEALFLLNASYKPDDGPFELDLTPLTEPEVDILVSHGGDTTYMATHNKLEGLLVLSDADLAELRSGDCSPIYKGQIADRMQLARTP